MFNPDDFMSMTVDAPMDTTVKPIDEGEYSALIDKAVPKVTNGGSALLEVFFKIDDPSNEEAHERTVRYTCWLDTTEAGGLDMGKGKNVQLGRLRAAVGQNVSGQAWSPGLLAGNVCMISVKQRPDKDDPQIVYNDVKSVAALG